jgi:predicted dehydrogenase
MANKLRLGIIGANMRSHWASRSHFPALLASADWEVTAVCTTRQESADEARVKMHAKLAFDDYRKMVASPEIDAVLVVVRVPSHYEPTRAALEAGKHVYTEWPLGRTTAEAEELTKLAHAKGVRTATGLQARLNPKLMYMKEQIESGYVGDVYACHVSFMRNGHLQRPSDRTWQRDVTFGANTLTISNGHAIDALRFVVGNFTRVGAMVTTQAKQWLETDTKKLVDVTSPDNILVNGRLTNSAVASVHVSAVPWAGSGYRMEVYGSEGTLVASGEDAPQHTEVHLYGARGKEPLRELEVPSRFRYVGTNMPAGEPYNVGQMYTRFAHAIRTGQGGHPDFDTAVGLHRFLDDIKRASDTGQEVSVEN